MPDIHPFLVHFPIALYLTGLFLDLLGVVRRDPAPLRAGWYLLAASCMGCILAVGSGLLAKGAVDVRGPALESFALHEQLALATGAGVCLLFYWRLTYRGDIPVSHRNLYLLAALITAGLMVSTGLLGGILVFEHGIGVR
jgi:uncharacterized membrane protein